MYLVVVESPQAAATVVLPQCPAAMASVLLLSGHRIRWTQRHERRKIKYGHNAMEMAAINDNSMDIHTNPSALYPKGFLRCP